MFLKAHRLKQQNDLTNHPYEKLAKQQAQFAQSILFYVLGKYQSFIQYFIVSQSFIYQTISITSQNKKYIWKGILIQKLFHTFKLKSYICEKLKYYELNPNISLSEFFMKSKNKILLTFTTLNRTKNKIQFINKNTLPRIPVWAAILCSASASFLFKSFEMIGQWKDKYLQINSLQNIIFDNFFKQNQNSNISDYVCGNIISSLPIQLLTNNQIMRKMFELDDFQNIQTRQQQNSKENIQNNNQKSDKKVKNSLPHMLFLAVSFDYSQIKSNLKDNHLKVKNISKIDVIKLLFSFFCKGVENKFGQIKQKITNQNNICNQLSHKNQSFNFSSPGIKKFIGMLKSTNSVKSLLAFTESNDNLIMDLYEDKVIKCPIKIGTLDFHKITQKDLNKNIYIPTSNTRQTVQRSYFITKRFIEEQIDKKFIQIRIQFEFQNNHLKNKNAVQKKLLWNNQEKIKCKIIFLSHSKWNKSKEKLLIIKWKAYNKQQQKKTDRFQEYKEVQNQQIQWDLQQPALNLDFYYPFYDQKTENINYVVKNPITLSFANLIERQNNNQFNQSVSNLSLSSHVSYYFNLDYRKSYQKVPCSKIESSINNSFIVDKLNYQKKNLFIFTRGIQTLTKPLHSGLIYQFNLDIIHQIIHENQNNQNQSSQSNNQSKQKNASLPCIYCLKKLKIINNSQHSEQNKCRICNKKIGKLRCYTTNCEPVYCLECVKLYAFKRQEDGLKCLLCSVEANNQFYYYNSFKRLQHADTKSIKINSQKISLKNQTQSKNQLYRKQMMKQLQKCDYCEQIKTKYQLLFCINCQLKICNQCVNLL